jgi:hypothetical protein
MANYQSLIGERVKIYERDETNPNEFVARGVLREVFFIIDNFRFKGVSSIIPRQHVQPLGDYMIVKDEDQPNNNIPSSGSDSPPYVPSPYVQSSAMPTGSPFGGTVPGAPVYGVQPLALASVFNTVGAPLVPTMTALTGDINMNLPAFPINNLLLNTNSSARRSRKRRATHRKRRATHSRRHRRS